MFGIPSLGLDTDSPLGAVVRSQGFKKFISRVGLKLYDPMIKVMRPEDKSKSPFIRRYQAYVTALMVSQNTKKQKK